MQRTEFIMLRSVHRLALALCAVLIAVVFVAAPAPAANPTVAVLNFSTQGLTSTWWGEFQPGIAISDLLSDQLVNGGKFRVVDRKNLDSTLAEHRLSASGEVAPAAMIQSGRLVGARYLISGNVIQFDRTGSSGAAVGGFLGGYAGAAAGAVKSDRVTLRVTARVVDAVSGEIVQSISAEQTKSSVSLGGFGYSGWTAGGYSNEQFTSSTMGQLINSVAQDIASKIDATKFAASAPAGPAIAGRILAVDGPDVTLNVGAAKGVTVGMYFDVVKVRQLKDPDSGKMLTSKVPIAKIQITSVTDDTSVGRTISGTPAVSASATSE
jgi:curli biogenesis system outer membrane secretion channel CsgG